MATSGSTNYSSTRDILIERALRIVGALGQGESATSAQLSEGAIALNHLAKALHADGMPLWAVREYAITLTSGTRSYTIGEGSTINTPYPLKIISALRRYTSDTTDIQLKVVSRDEYERISNKTIEGLPLILFYDKQRTTGTLYFYPVPDDTAASDYTYRITYQRPFEDFDATGDEPDFPSEWFDALAFLLADRLAPEYGVPKEIAQDITRRAIQYKQEALNFGTEEGSVFFQVDRRLWEM